MPKAWIAPVRLIGAQCLPLLGGEDGAQTKEHAGVGFLKLRASLCDAINLRQDPGLVRLVRSQQRLHRRLLFAHRGKQIHQTGAVLLEDDFHFLLLICGKS